MQTPLAILILSYKKFHFPPPFLNGSDPYTTFKPNRLLYICAHMFITPPPSLFIRCSIHGHLYRSTTEGLFMWCNTFDRREKGAYMLLRFKIYGTVTVSRESVFFARCLSYVKYIARSLSPLPTPTGAWYWNIVSCVWEMYEVHRS